ncbi:hypothetical protein JG687_00003769 [Phytophthora cactorum]|uniref:Uncharacterized protein n=1 Tax=Phytophthora cactorum TaxID=29920 RepID=A0A8T1URT7_9STRA|nr:hypothetical protein JG687_00003769 [Phytophthora cactorum]
MVGVSVDTVVDAEQKKKVIHQLNSLENSEDDTDPLEAVARNVATKDEHVPRENPDYQIVNRQRKRRQRQCKVCSSRKRNVAGGGTGKRKRHRRSLNGEDVDESAENTADDEVTGSNTVGDVSGQGAVDDDAVHEDGAEENAADEAAAEERAAEENDENEDGA